MISKIVFTSLTIIPLLAFGGTTEQAQALQLLLENQSIPISSNTDGKLKAFFDVKKNNIASPIYPKKINTDVSKMEDLKGTWNLAFKIGEKAYTEKLDIDLAINSKGEFIGIGENRNLLFLVCIYDPELYSKFDSDYQCGATATLNSGEKLYTTFSFKFSGNSITSGYYGIGETLAEAVQVQVDRLYPITGSRENPQSVKNAEYDEIKKVLNIQDVQIGSQHYQVTLQSAGNDEFSLKSAQLLNAATTNRPAQYDNADLTLFIPKVKAFGNYYQVQFKNIGNYAFKMYQVENYY